MINTNIKSPILLIAFFITREYPATAAQREAPSTTHISAYFSADLKT